MGPSFQAGRVIEPVPLQLLPPSADGATCLRRAMPGDAPGRIRNRHATARQRRWCSGPRNSGRSFEVTIQLACSANPADPGDRSAGMCDASLTRAHFRRWTSMRLLGIWLTQLGEARRQVDEACPRRSRQRATTSFLACLGLPSAAKRDVLEPANSCEARISACHSQTEGPHRFPTASVHRALGTAGAGCTRQHSMRAHDASDTASSTA